MSISRSDNESSPGPRPQARRSGARIGAGLLDRTHTALTEYIRFPSPEAADGWTLLTVASHGQPAWEHAPRGIAQSVISGSGKSRLFNVSRHLIHNPRKAASASAAWISRTLDVNDPYTLIYEEADRIYANPYKSEQTELLTAILDNGFDRDNEYYRWDMKRDCEAIYPTFCMVLLASMGINVLPPQLMDRALVITLVKARPGEVKEFRRKPRFTGPLDSLRDDIHGWLRPQLPALADCEPEIPVDYRAAEKWEPLVIVADAAGGKWPERARNAAGFMEAIASLAGSMPREILILSDIRDVMGRAPFIKTGDLIARLRDIPESPWDDERLSDMSLAAILRKHGIRSSRDGSGKVRGYRLADLAPAFAAYLPDRPEPVPTAVNPSEPVRARQSPGQSDIPLTGSDGFLTGNGKPVRSVSPGQGNIGRALTGSDGLQAKAAGNGAESPAADRARGRAGRHRPGAPGARQDGSAARDERVNRILTAETETEIFKAGK